MIIQISIDSKWLFSDNGKHTDTIRQILRALNRKWDTDFRGKDAGLSDCRFEYNGKSDFSSVASEVKEVLQDITKTDFDEALFHVQFEADSSRKSPGKIIRRFARFGRGPPLRNTRGGLCRRKRRGKRGTPARLPGKRGGLPSGFRRRKRAHGRGTSQRAGFIP